MNTTQQYKAVFAGCKDIFLKKNRDYGTAWRILRLSSLTDQLFIKASRIRSIEEKKEMRIEEGVEDEFVGIVNYAIMALIQIELKDDDTMEVPLNELEAMYDRHAEGTFNLMNDKNHDYGEAWRDMRISSMTDLILMKLLRIKQIEDNAGQTIISEGIDANFMDIVNYAVFALIRITEQKENQI